MKVAFALVTLSASVFAQHCLDPPHDPSNGIYHGVTVQFFRYDSNDWRNYRGMANEYFDPTKPTLIYVPGLSTKFKTNGRRLAFKLGINFNLPFLRQYFAENIEENYGYTQHGWNIGMLDHILYTDDSPIAVESKIHSNVTKQSKLNRWRDDNGELHTPCNIPPPVKDLLFDILQNIDPNLELRMVGLSLGAQVVLATAKRMADRFGRNMRVVLLDPIWLTFGTRIEGKSLPEIGFDEGKYIADCGGINFPYLKELWSIIVLKHSCTFHLAPVGSANQTSLCNRFRHTFDCGRNTFPAVHSRYGSQLGAIR